MLFDYVLENVTAPGTGTSVALAGAVSGRKSYSQVTTNGSAVFYYLDDGTQSEWGFGVFSVGTPNTVSRATVIGNTSATTSRLNFSGTTKIYNALPASRAVWLDANLAKTSGMIVNGLDAGGLHFRAVNGSYGAGLLNNGSSGYLLSTNSGSQYGAYNALRPFAWNFSTGAINIDFTGAGVTFGSGTAGDVTLNGGALVLNNSKWVYGKDTGATNRPILGVDSANNTTTWLANAAAVWRVINFAGTATLFSVGNSGATACTGSFQAGGTLIGNTNIQAGYGGTGGYVCKAGLSGGFGSNVFNFLWSSPYVYTYIDNSNIGAIQVVSDERYKHAIAPLTDGALSRILSLRPVHFFWRDRGIFRDDHRRHDGLIAQEVRRHIPDAVIDAGADETLSLNPLALISHLVKAVQELSARVQQLEAERG